MDKFLGHRSQVEITVPDLNVCINSKVGKLPWRDKYSQSGFKKLPVSFNVCRRRL